MITDENSQDTAGQESGESNGTNGPLILDSTELKREFHFEKNGKTIKLEDFNPLLPPEEILKFHSGQYPELTTAKMDHEFVGSNSVYKVSTKVGTKG